MKCSCVDPNAIFCFRARHNISPEQFDTEEDEACSCYCHALQEWEEDENEKGLFLDYSCPKCGGEIGHKINCPDGICFSGEK